jgi:hypothetical protein
MKFQRGQKVVCINDRFSSYCSHPVIKGRVYTIQGSYRCVCGSNQVTLFEKPYNTYMKCGCGRVSERRQSYYNWRFLPLEYFENYVSLSSKKNIPEELIAGIETILQGQKKNPSTINLKESILNNYQRASLWAVKYKLFRHECGN